MRGHNNCQWLNIVERDFCGKSCIGTYCKVHLLKNRQNRKVPEHCRSCHRGLQSELPLCRSCHRGLQSELPLCRACHRGLQSELPLCRACHRGLQSELPLCRACHRGLQSELPLCRACHRGLQSELPLCQACGRDKLRHSLLAKEKKVTENFRLVMRLLLVQQTPI